ncbi:lactate utilization protein LutB domain-containing protein, partial [Streptomyces sp. NPDC003300]|uniref:lactate utilisation protein LutB domain-containing protein n=1 Tax=Streptomyces sp. NPDC003300 TaxID=3154446 RepID=UPI0033B12F85
ACYDVCPVAINIPQVLVHLRERVAQGATTTHHGQRVTIKPAKGHAAERATMRAARWTLDHPGVMRQGQRLATRTRHLHPQRLPGPAKAWTTTRDLPTLPPQTFRDWWQHNKHNHPQTKENGQ